jgi:membrane protease YdiL (CAAX protease family)
VACCWYASIQLRASSIKHQASSIENPPMPETLAQNYPSRLTVVIILFLITAPLYGLVGFFGTATTSKWPILLGELLLPLPAYLYLRFSRYNIRQIFRLNPVSWRLMILSAGLAVAFYLVVYEIDRLLNAVWIWIWRSLPPEFDAFSPDIMQAQLDRFLMASSWWDWVMIVFAMVIVAGLFEEMLFRGFVQSAFEQHHKMLTAVLITAAIFAANHAIPWWFLQIFLLGSCLGWMAWRCDSIIPSAIAHGVNNLFAVFFVNLKSAPSWLFWQDENFSGVNEHLHPIILILAGAAIYFGFLWFNRFCEEESEIPTFLNTPV